MTVSYKTCVRRGKYCLEFSFAWGRLKISSPVVRLAYALIGINKAQHGIS